MLIPIGPSGFPTLYNSRLRAYGAAGFLMEYQDLDAGCPRLYRKKYVDKDGSTQKSSFPLSYGTTIHRALYLMEERAIGPEQALDECWPADLDVEAWREAQIDLAKYLERGGPMNRFGTISVETELGAELFVDDEIGPVWYAAKIDWIGVDVEQPSVLHVVDYKTNRSPPSKADVQGDVQLKGQDWVTRQNWSKFMPGGRPQVVMHLDAIKWYDVEHVFRESELEEWHEWAAAIGRTILRDQRGAPKLNAGCGWCPVKHDCPAYGSLPSEGTSLLARKTETKDLVELYAWREEAAGVVKALKAGIEEIDAAVKETVNVDGVFSVPGRIWELDVDYANVLDLRQLLDVIGLESFLELASVSLRAAKEWARRSENEELILAVERCIDRQATGTKVKSRKVKGDDGDVVG